MRQSKNSIEKVLQLVDELHVLFEEIKEEHEKKNANDKLLETNFLYHELPAKPKYALFVIMNVCQVFMVAKTSERKVILDSVKKDKTLVEAIYSYVLHTSVEGVREKSLDKLESSVTALEFLEGIIDIRDIITALSLLYNSLITIGVDAQEVLKKYIQDVAIIDSFLKRPEKEKSIGVMGYKAVGSGESFNYCNIRNYNSG